MVAIVRIKITIAFYQDAGLGLSAPTLQVPVLQFDQSKSSRRVSSDCHQTSAVATWAAVQTARMAREPSAKEFEASIDLRHGRRWSTFRGRQSNEEGCMGKCPEIRSSVPTGGRGHFPIQPVEWNRVGTAFAFMEIE